MNIKHKVVAAGLAAALAGGLVLQAPMCALAVTQSDVDQAREKLSALGSQLSGIEDSLNQATSDVEQTAYEIGQKEAQIGEAQAELAAKRETLSGIMRSNFKQGSSSALDFILGSQSIDELVSRVYYMDKVNQQHENAISEVKAAEDQLNQEQAELQAKQDEQNRKVSDLQGQADDYAAQVSAARDYVSSLDSQLQAQLAEAAAKQSESAMAAALNAVKEQETQQEAQASSGDEGSKPAEEPAQKPSEPQKDPEPSTPKPSEGSQSGGGVATALAQIGKPYVWGATGPNSFDCSGLICYSYGYARGRDTYSMIASLQASGDWKTSMDQLSYGDLVFTSAGHVGIYLGGGMMVHAPHPGASVCKASVYAFYGGGTY